MIEAIIAACAAIVGSVLSLIGVIITNKRSTNKILTDIKLSHAVYEEKVDELTREVRFHNDFARRVPVMEEQIKVINHRIQDIENADKRK